EHSLRLTKDEQAKEQEKAQDALDDVEKLTTTENKMLSDLEDLYNEYPGDNELRTFLDKRRRTVLEHEEVYTGWQARLAMVEEALGEEVMQFAF
ncbi:unnamed protein product, partial [Fusarium langsethiae]